MTLKKPEKTADLLPPFTIVGEPGWNARLRAWLTDFGFQFAQPSTEAELVAAEARLGMQLPNEWRAFLLAFGPLDLDGVRLSAPEEIVRLEDVWFQSHLSEQEQELLPWMLQVAECGSDDFVAFNTLDGCFCRCCHDPGGFWDWCPSFSDFLRLELVRLWSGYYGWPDENVEMLVEDVTEAWLNAWERERPSG